jgi:uncharacterized protein
VRDEAKPIALAARPERGRLSRPAAALGAAARRRIANLSYRLGSAFDRLALSRELPPRVADSFVRSSRYVTVRDGTRIALDLYRPARRGVELVEPLPVVWTQERYHRARFEGGRLVTRLDTEPWLKLLIRLGYVVGVADLRGSGASFGSRRSLVLDQDSWDAHDVTEWLAARSWSNGRVGMFGKSFMGLTQYLAASTAPPHLVAILPEKTLFDLYAFAHAGGVFREDYGRAWGAHITELDTIRPAAPVDEDADGTLLACAIEEHRANCDVFSVFADLPFRDSARGVERPYDEQSPATRLDAIGRSGVAVLQIAGWHDMWPRDALLWHRNLPNPRRLVIGPWPHTQDGGWQLFMERLRWFDYWLKGQDNGVMEEASIRYFTIGAPRDRVWRSTASWPLSAARPTDFHFRADSGTAGSGSLGRDAPAGPGGADEWTVDYTATTGQGSRWRNGYGLEFGYPDMAANDARGLTYTTAPLERDLEVTGHPVATIWVSCSANDVDLFVYLEEIGRGGRSVYVSEGVLRASHRAVEDPPYDNLGLPWHASRQACVSRLPRSEPVELVMDLHPVSRVFRAGRRIRVTLTGADADNSHTPIQVPPPRITVHTSRRHPSRIVLPVVPASGRP